MKMENNLQVNLIQGFKKLKIQLCVITLLGNKALVLLKL